MARLVVNSERPILLSRGTSAGVALTASRSLFRRSSSYGLTSRVLKPISNQCDLLRTATRLKTPSAIRGLYTAQSLTAPSRHPHVRLPRYALPSPVPRPGCSRSTRISRSFRAKASTSCPSCRYRAGEVGAKLERAPRLRLVSLCRESVGPRGFRRRDLRCRQGLANLSLRAEEDARDVASGPIVRGEPQPVCPLVRTMNA